MTPPADPVLDLLREIRDAVATPAAPSLFVRACDLPAVIGVRATRCRELRDEPGFPPPVALPGEPLWLRAAVAAWAAALKPAARRRKPRRAKAAS